MGSCLPSPTSFHSNFFLFEKSQGPWLPERIAVLRWAESHYGVRASWAMGSYLGSSPRVWLGLLSVPRWHFTSVKTLWHQERWFFRCGHFKNQLTGFNQVSSRHKWLWLFWVKISSRTRSFLRRKWLSSIEKLLKWLVTSRTSGPQSSQHESPRYWEELDHGRKLQTLAESASLVDILVHPEQNYDLPALWPSPAILQ